MDQIKQAVGFGIKHSPPALFGAVVDAGNSAEGVGPTYRNVNSLKGLVEQYDPSIHTVWDAFISAAAKFPDRPYHGARVIGSDGQAGPFVFTTYSEVKERVFNFGSGLQHLDLLQPDSEKRMTLLGIMGRNAPEWSVAELASMGWGGTTVPLYDSLKGEVLAGVLIQNSCATVVCDAPSAAQLLAVKPKCPALKTIIVYGPKAETISSEVVKVVRFEELESLGRAHKSEPNPPNPQTFYSFVYTSGSTGTPKGALITQAAAVANISAIFMNDSSIQGLEWLNGQEAHMSFLPMAHALERAVQTLIIVTGSCVGFSQGNRDRILDDIKALRPTFFPSVPRLLNRIYDKILSTVKEAGGLKQFMFETALAAKMDGLREGYLKHPVWDTLVFTPMKQKMGFDRLRRIMTGSAPVAGAVLDFFRAAFGVMVVEGYGASETVCVATGTHGHSFTSEHVGAPGMASEIRLMSVLSMNYLVTDKKHGDLDVLGRGEVCIRGPAMFTEYYRAPEQTKAAIDAEGFYHSGDVGVMLPNGTLKIVDRVRNIFKLSNGEYVAVEKIENIMARCSLVTQALVYGDSVHSKLVAIVVPDVDTAVPWAKENGLATTDINEICANPKFKQAVLAEMNQVGRKNELFGYEIPGAIHLEPVPFSPDNILTPTFKIQRALAKALYANIFEELLGKPE